MLEITSGKQKLQSKGLPKMISLGKKKYQVKASASVSMTLGAATVKLPIAALSLYCNPTCVQVITATSKVSPRTVWSILRRLNRKRSLKSAGLWVNGIRSGVDGVSYRRRFWQNTSGTDNVPTSKSTISSRHSTPLW